MRHFNLETFAGGELSRQINRDIEAVMRNVVDPNTDVKAKRKITVTIEFKPNEQRNRQMTICRIQIMIRPL